MVFFSFFYNNLMPIVKATQNKELQALFFSCVATETPTPSFGKIKMKPSQLKMSFLDFH